MPPPPSDLLSRVGAFLPQLAKANDALLTTTVGASCTPSSPAKAVPPSAAVASLQIDAGMVQCGDGDSSSSEDSDSDGSDGGGSKDAADDEEEERAPPTIEMSIALGPFGGSAGGGGGVGSGEGGDDNDDGNTCNTDQLQVQPHQEEQMQSEQQSEQQPKKRKVLIEELS